MKQLSHFTQLPKFSEPQWLYLQVRLLLQLIIEHLKDYLVCACLIHITSSPVIARGDFSQVMEPASFQFGEQRIIQFYFNFFPFNKWTGVNANQVNKMGQALYDRRSREAGPGNNLCRKNVAIDQDTALFLR